jgi:hypothetical protein
LVTYNTYCNDLESEQDHEYAFRTIGIVGTSSFCVVLPKDYAINLGIGKGDPVRVTREKRRIVIEKA